MATIAAVGYGRFVKESVMLDFACRAAASGFRTSIAVRTLTIMLLFGRLLAASGQAAEGYADIRPEPAGSRIFCLCGDEIRLDPAGNRLLFIDGDTLRPQPGGERLLFIDGDDVRPAPGGIRVAFFDGQFLRRSPGGPILLFIDGQDIRPEAGGKRLLFIDGGPLTRPQLVAVLYHWKPELFKLSPAEEAALKAEMEKNAKAAEEAARSKFLGKFQVLNSSAPAFNNGTIEVAPTGNYYTVTFYLSDNTKFQGIAVQKEVQGEEEFWFAASPTGAVGLGVYEPEGIDLKAIWIPLAVTPQGPDVLGHETIYGPPNFAGNYTVKSGKFTMRLGDYTGSLHLAMFPADNPSVTLDPRALTWTVAGKKFSGIGTAVEYEAGKFALIAAVSTEKIYLVGRLKETTSSGIHMDLLTNTRNTGFILLNKQNP